MFLGPGYALLHPKYFDSFNSKVELRDFKKIFVSFGSGTMTFEAKQRERAVGVWTSIPVNFRLK